MTATPVDVTLARRELVLVAVILVAFARLVERSDAFLVVVLLPAVMLLAGSAILRADERPGRPIESLLVPAVLTGGTAAALQLVPAGLGLVPALAAFAFGLDRILALEIRLLAQSTGVTDADRARILGGAMVTAFIAFTGVAALVPGGLPEPGSTGIDAGLSEGWLAGPGPGRCARGPGPGLPRRVRALWKPAGRAALGADLRDRHRGGGRRDPRRGRAAGLSVPPP